MACELGLCLGESQGLKTEARWSVSRVSGPITVPWPGSFSSVPAALLPPLCPRRRACPHWPEQKRPCERALASCRTAAPTGQELPVLGETGLWWQLLLLGGTGISLPSHPRVSTPERHSPQDPHHPWGPLPLPGRQSQKPERMSQALGLPVAAP